MGEGFCVGEWAQAEHLTLVSCISPSHKVQIMSPLNHMEDLDAGLAEDDSVKSNTLNSAASLSLGVGLLN